MASIRRWLYRLVVGLIAQIAMYRGVDRIADRPHGYVAHAGVEAGDMRAAEGSGVAQTAAILHGYDVGPTDDVLVVAHKSKTSSREDRGRIHDRTPEARKSRILAALAVFSWIFGFDRSLLYYTE